MQARAIFEAACDVAATGKKVHPEVMIPLVGAKTELDDQVAVVRRVAAEVFAERGRKVPYRVGPMIEVPRGAVTAAAIAETAEFFSFGTNDLTQTTFGLSRDDTVNVLAAYLQKEIWPSDPFVTLDRDGVGVLMRMAVEGGRRTRPKLHVGICGERGGDPASVRFCHELGLDYVSCSPFRLPIARLAAAQAAIDERLARKAAAKHARVKARAKAGVRAKAKVQPMARGARKVGARAAARRAGR
jgi:pyruvate,orthophosphate dikinase